LNFLQKLLGHDNRVLRSVSAALFPIRCRACGAFLPPDAESPAAAGFAGRDRFDPVLAGFLCPKCLAACTPVDAPLCTRCGTVFPADAGEDHLCGRCLERPPAFSKARAAALYDRTMLALVHDFKYRGRTELARPLAALMLATFYRFWKPGEIDSVVAVPLHHRRLRSRGFNQAALLARQWDLRACGGRRPGPMLEGALVRRRSTPAQTGLGRRQRLMNLRGAFALGRRADVSGKNLLLVDDVLTTGATAEACSRVLKEGGAVRVDVLTLARSVAAELYAPVARSADESTRGGGFS
jgi:ComF family protein